jgi:hypothetical protein
VLHDRTSDYGSNCCLFRTNGHQVPHKDGRRLLRCRREAPCGALGRVSPCLRGTRDRATRQGPHEEGYYHARSRGTVLSRRHPDALAGAQPLPSRIAFLRRGKGMPAPLLGLSADAAIVTLPYHGAGPMVGGGNTKSEEPAPAPMPWRIHAGCPPPRP